MIFCQESDCRPSPEESAAESFRCVTFCKNLFTDQLLIHIMGRVTGVTRASLPRATDGKMSDTRVPCVTCPWQYSLKSVSVEH